LGGKGWTERARKRRVSIFSYLFFLFPTIYVAGSRDRGKMRRRTTRRV